MEILALDARLSFVLNLYLRLRNVWLVPLDFLPNFGLGNFDFSRKFCYYLLRSYPFSDRLRNS